MKNQRSLEATLVMTFVLTLALIVAAYTAFAIVRPAFQQASATLDRIEGAR
jgi:hypothetical protein